ncbi:PREDICTED: pectinesterase-like [Ipomoea nil]|uniref:pectinesterase-like n=1 Tax=Ipomoea nil TaxID=35883 RepID=UPI000901A3CB|nr:PREDICTED: pectinesterase-like [Ipomoea nil]
MAFQDFDMISERRKRERAAKLKKRIITASILLVIILLIAAAAFAYFVVLKGPHDDKGKQSTKAGSHNDGDSAAASDSSDTPDLVKSEKMIKTLCTGTDFTTTCEGSLNKAAKENASAARNPKDLVKASMAVAVEEIQKAVKQVSGLKLDTPLKKAALEDCKALLGDAMEELRSSMSSVANKEMGNPTAKTPELNNWLSAAITFQDDCADGFPDGPDKTAIKKFLKTSEEIASNALAMISQLSSVLSTLHIPDSDPKRHLLSDGDEEFPTWMDNEERRMLKGGAADIPKQPPDATVGKGGKFPTINAALKAIPEKHPGRYVIFVKEGIYAENVKITKKMANLTIYGEGSKKSIITGSKNYVDGIPTYQTATFAVMGDGFLGQSLGFRNTAGPEKHQAVALRVQADKAVFVSCRMEGYQDTLYAQAHRQFYRGCFITGTVDFIFGNAAAVFQSCTILARKPLDKQQNIVTAQGRSDKRQTTGTVLQNCKILADEKLEPVKKTIKTYLGRPWKEYSRTIIMESEIGDVIDPEGFTPWKGDFALKTLYYAEYANTGPGAKTNARVKWSGYKGEIKKDEATPYTVAPFIQGEPWIKPLECPARYGFNS